ncbi:MAG TPA: L-aspartate oxidase [Steroidobacteraceae bacterium]|nr:L-aspartate oxidase [Steroidobacteraceae bacterium]
MSDPIESDVLILGCGIAGGTTALELADAGLDVLIVTRAAEIGESNTYWAQGGIIFKGDEDAPELLGRDIENAGGGICRPEAVEILARSGPRLVQSLLIDRLKVPFDRRSDGRLALGREGGHSMARIAHATDATGRAIENALIAELKRHPKVRFLTGHTAVDLLTPAHHGRDRRAIYDPLSCVGAYVLDQATGNIVRCYARATVLATGGLGQIFLRTTNPAGSRGDGLAMAYRAGARVINTEYVQFHPTAFYHRNAPCFLITEAVRGAGARLVDERGVPFMERYDAHWKDLAPRDVVARSIHAEMLRRGVTNVYLDLRSYIPVERIRAEFPEMLRSCLEYGFDITRDLLPVVPAAHYSCGGVWVDDNGLSTVQRLYAVGEVSCTGLHGANRLASTSLLEGLVWGHRAARHMSENLPPREALPFSEIPEWRPTGRVVPDLALISQDFSSIKHIMWNYVGLVRTTRRLERAIRDLRNLEVEGERFYRAAALTDDLIGLRNAIRVALIVTFAAWENHESRGCHYRE